MIKKILLMFAILFVVLTNQAFAHTGLESSSPNDGEIVNEPLQQITLQFATKIEQTSTVDVSNSNGEQVSLGNFVIEDKEIWATFLQPLKNDIYKVSWKIVGEDGHPIEGEFYFTVDTPVEETPKEEQTIENSNQSKKVQNEQKEDESLSEPKKEEEQNLPTYLIPLIVVVLFLVGMGLLWWLLRRK